MNALTITVNDKFMVLFSEFNRKTARHKNLKMQSMNQLEISYKSTDQIIDSLKRVFEIDGLPGVIHWADDLFREDKQISLARDVTNLHNIDHGIIYDRSIIGLNQDGEETDNYYLHPIHDDAFGANLFLSIRLNFVNQPFELLIFTK